MTDTLLIVDMQHDFIHGSLPVPGADEIIMPILEAAHGYDRVVCTGDAHPPDHCSFASRWGVQPFTWRAHERVYPDHCIAGTKGAEIDGRLLGHADAVLWKGGLPDVEQYSGFYHTALDEQLQEWGVTAVDVVGVAGDICVSSTAIDAANLGYKTAIIVSLTRSINALETTKLANAGVLLV